jgi:hypothetical protein
MLLVWGSRQDMTKKVLVKWSMGLTDASIDNETDGLIFMVFVDSLYLNVVVNTW